MARRETAKGAVWRERFGRFHGSGMSVARFCEAEGVSVPSFYQWRRKLQSESGAGQARPAFQQVVVTPGATLRVRFASGAEIEMAAGNLDVIRAVVAELARAECEFAGEDAAC